MGQLHQRKHGGHRGLTTPGTTVTCFYISFISGPRLRMEIIQRFGRKKAATIIINKSLVAVSQGALPDAPNCHRRIGVATGNMAIGTRCWASCNGGTTYSVTSPASLCNTPTSVRREDNWIEIHTWIPLSMCDKMLVWITDMEHPNFNNTELWQTVGYEYVQWASKALDPGGKHTSPWRPCLRQQRGSHFIIVTSRHALWYIRARFYSFF